MTRMMDNKIRASRSHGSGWLLISEYGVVDIYSIGLEEHRMTRMMGNKIRASLVARQGSGAEQQDACRKRQWVLFLYIFCGIIICWNPLHRIGIGRTSDDRNDGRSSVISIDAYCCPVGAARCHWTSDHE